NLLCWFLVFSSWLDWFVKTSSEMQHARRTCELGWTAGCNPAPPARSGWGARAGLKRSFQCGLIMQRPDLPLDVEPQCQFGGVVRGSSEGLPVLQTSFIYKWGRTKEPVDLVAGHVHAYLVIPRGGFRDALRWQLRIAANYGARHYGEEQFHYV